MTENETILNNEINRLNRIIEVLMNRAEQSTDFQESGFNLFERSITLENQIQQRTSELQDALSENKKISRALRESESRYRLIIENAPMAIIEMDLNGRILSINMAGYLMLGFKENGILYGFPYPEIVKDSDREFINELLEKTREGETCQFEYEVDRDGAKVYKSRFIPIRDKRETIIGLMSITEDITELKLNEAKAHMLAFYDPLTKLPNRRLMQERLKQAIATSRRSSLYGALMFIDLDNFKPLNDKFGHDAGDLLLIEAGERLKKAVREVDLVARIGGDEFVVLISELNETRESSRSDARNIAKNIRKALSLPYQLVSRQSKSETVMIEHICTSSIGISLFFQDELDSDQILKRADMAMYQSKSKGRNTFSLYSAKG